MKQFSIPALAAAATLVAPAAALAHPSVYADVAKVVDSSGPPVTVKDETRYVVTNHGFTYVLRESNGAAKNGVVDYKKLPGAYRNQPGFTKTRLLSEGDTGAQAHATCVGVPALAAESAVLGWQGSDPFYNYVPFQATAAGLEDSPSAWLDDVRRLTGVELTASTNLANACASLGGTLRPADATQTSVAALNSGALEEATAPLEAEVAKLTAERDAARAQIPGLSLAAAPLKVTVAQATTSAVEVAVSAPGTRGVSLRAVVGPQTAKRLKRRSRILGTLTVNTGADGKARGTLKLARTLPRGTQVKVEAVSGDRVTSTFAKAGG